MFFFRALTVLIVGIVASMFIIFSNNEPRETAVEIKEEALEKQATTSAEEISEKMPEEKTGIISEEKTPSEPKVMVSSKEEVEITDLTSELIDLIVSIPPIEETTLSTQEINTRVRKALVNVICTSKQGGLLQPITGSGIIIDKRGVILTNAHIAQYYLLRNYIVPDYLECNIRTGSPAVNTYKAELLFISSSWITDNYQKIAQSNPKGTGENDFALLLITGTTKPGTTLPETFPFISPDLREGEPEIGDSTIVAAYPAGFLGGISIQKDLYAVTTEARVMEIFTFKENTLDLFSVGGNIAAQKGSSGGAIVGRNGGLLGIVVTATEAKDTDDRDLRAITLSHINRSLEKESGINLNNYLLGGLLGKSFQFNEIVAPGLTALLESILNQ